MRLDKLTLAVTDGPAMRAFYNAVFDANLQAVEGTPFHVGEIAGIEIMFCPNEITQIEAEKNRIQLRLTVGDIQKVVAAAKANGGDTYGESYDDASVMFWGVVDPDGNSIELRQVL
jgi:predicted enzyme related to lactoylglutathione lyase